MFICCQTLLSCQLKQMSAPLRPPCRYTSTDSANSANVIYKIKRGSSFRYLKYCIVALIDVSRHAVCLCLINCDRSRLLIAVACSQLPFERRVSVLTLQPHPVHRLHLTWYYLHTSPATHSLLPSF